MVLMSWPHVHSMSVIQIHVKMFGIVPFQFHFYSVSPVLRQAALNYMSDSDCFDLYQNANLDTTDDMQCFGTRQSSSPHQDRITGHRPFQRLKSTS